MVERSSLSGEAPAKKLPDPDVPKPADGTPQLSDAELDAVAGGTGGTTRTPRTNDIDAGVKRAVDL